MVDAGSSTGNTTDPDKASPESRVQIDLSTEDEEEVDRETIDDDDDMDFVPARERGEEDEDEYESASEGLSGIDIQFEVLEEGSEVMDEDSDGDEEDDDEEEEEEEGAETETELGAILDRGGAGRPVFVTREQIARMLGTNGFRRLLARGGIAQFLGGGDEEDSEDEDDDFGFDPRMPGRGTRSSRRTRPQVDFEKVPSEEGRKLMLSGTFGGNERGEDSFKRKKKLASRLLRREMGLGSHGRQKARDGLLRQVRYFEISISLKVDMEPNALWYRT
jgi:WD repeat-containing protein 23